MGLVSKEKLEIKWIPAVGSSLGAVTSAVVLSTLGVGGTLIGAALGSLLITVGGSVYSQSLQKTKARVGERVSTARTRVGQGNDTWEQSVSHGSVPVDAVTDESVKTSRDAGRGILRGLPWKRIIGVTVALFAITMALILAFEFSAGRSVSSITGGTSGTGGTSIPGIGSTVGDTDDSGTSDPGKDEPKQDEAPADEQPPEQDQAPQQDDEPAPQEQEQEQEPEQDQAPQQDPAPAPQKQEPAPEQPAAP